MGDEQETSQLIQRLLDTRDRDAANQLVEDNPGVRTLMFLQLLMLAGGKQERIEDFMRGAEVVLGCEWPGTLPQAMTLHVYSMNAAQGIADPNNIGEGPFENFEDIVDDCHPVFRVELSECAARAKIGLFHATADSRHIVDAAHYTERAMEFVDAINGPSFHHVSDLVALRLQAYRLTSDSDFLSSAVDLVRTTIEVAEEQGFELPLGFWNNVATGYLTQYHANGDRENLIAAEAIMADIVSRVAEDDEFRATFLATRAVVLGTIASDTGHHEFFVQAHLAFDEAFRIANQDQDRSRTMFDIDLFSRMTTDYASILGNLYSESGDESYLLTAVDLIELNHEVVSSSPGFDSDRLDILAINLNCDLFELTGDNSHLDSASGLHPLQSVLTGGTRDLNLAIEGVRAEARLARYRGDPAQAADLLSQVLEAFVVGASLAEGDNERIRTLALKAEGLIADAAGGWIAAGNLTEALAVVRNSRFWLGDPPLTESSPVHADRSVVWVFSTPMDTVVLSSEAAELGRVNVTAGELSRLFVRTFQAVRLGLASGILKAADSLFEALNRITRLLPTDRSLVIVPVGICSYLPFAGGRSSSGAYLIEDCSVTVSPDERWLDFSSRRTRPADNMGFAAFDRGSSALELDFEGEMADFSSLFPDALVLDSPSDSAELWDLMSQGDLVGHFACHATYDGFDPLRSMLYVGGGLDLQSVLNKELSTWLVNLAGCETGMSDQRRLDQMMSFATAFLRSGVAHVLASVWQVNDAHARAYSYLFYSNLCAGDRPAEAHRKALSELKGTVLDVEQPDHPFWWAGFTHLGSP